MSRAFVDTDSQLAAILGVTRPAVAKAECCGKITREEDGRWDVVAALKDWRSNTYASLQRPRQAREFRPWLDPATPLTHCIWQEFVRRADAQGADWEEGGDDEEDEEDDEEDEEDEG